jgi:hypothetical protein
MQIYIMNLMLLKGNHPPCLLDSFPSRNSLSPIFTLLDGTRTCATHIYDMYCHSCGFIRHPCVETDISRIRSWCFDVTSSSLVFCRQHIWFLMATQWRLVFKACLTVKIEIHEILKNTFPKFQHLIIKILQ